VVQAGPDPAQLQAQAEAPLDVVLAVDAASLAYEPGHDDAAWRDSVRRDAERAIFVRELAARAGCRTVPLIGDDAAAWQAALARLLALPAADCPSPEALPALAGPAAATSPLVAGYLAPLWAAGTAAAPLVLTWPRECFLDGDLPNQTLPPVMELAGRARILSYGPYLPLPSGSWRATACFGFSPDIERLPFIFEALTPPGITRGFFETEAGGFFTLDLEFQVTDPFARVEMRLASQDSALEGQAALIEVRLEAMSRP
jgi:hypothetical protein